MSWEDITTTANKFQNLMQAVVFSISPRPGAGKIKKLDVLLTVRTGLIDEAPDFLRKGSCVRVLTGRGEHFGLLRVTRGGVIKCCASGGRRGAPDGLVLIRIPLPAGIAARRGRSTAEYEYNDDWIEITIPDWARKDGAPPAASVPSPPAVTPKPPFGLAAGVKHDVRRGS